VVEPLGTVFAAVPIPVEIRMALADSVSALDIPGRRVPPEDWHVTLRFLGRIERVTLERFMHGLAPIADVPRFRFGLRGLGAFPQPRKATVVWVGIGRGLQSLSVLNEMTEEAVVGAGLVFEDKPFRPHLTLSRVRPPQDVTNLLDNEVRLDWWCDRVVVYETRPPGEPVHYRPLETILLAGTG